MEDVHIHNNKDFLDLQNETCLALSICQHESQHFSSLLHQQVWNSVLRVSKQTSFTFFILLLLFPKPLQSIISEQSSLFEYQLNPKLDQFTVVLCKVKTIQCHYYCTPSIPSKCDKYGYYNICDRKQLLPPLLLFLCWEGDGRHLLAHLFTLQTRPKLDAFPVVFQKQVIK